MAVVNSGHLCKLGSGHKKRRAQELLQAKNNNNNNNNSKIWFYEVMYTFP